MKCPICGAKLEEVGYPKDGFYQEYRCPNGCKFWKHWKWKAHYYISHILAIITIAFFIVLAIPLGLIGLIKRRK